jgi:hypothetical protein
MAVGMVYPDPEKGGRGKRSQKREGLAQAIGVSNGRAANLISQARAVLASAPDLVKAVMM